MNKIITLSLLTATVLMAGGDIAPVEPAVEVVASPEVKESAFFKTVDGYVRAGYQQDGDSNSDLALGGKLHVETNAWYGLSAGASFYTTHVVGNNDGAGVPFFNSENESYDILGEAYIKAQFGNTIFKAGRQEIDTPYADTDDIGMIPNTFEAYVLTNTDLPSTTIIAALVKKMAGVDADTPEKFTNIGMDGGIPTVGVIFEGVENLAVQAWYYNVQDSAGDRGFTYFDGVYGTNIGSMGLEVGAQYATQDAFTGDMAGDASIYGLSVVLGLESAGLSFSGAYNSTDGTAADNGFGGGPFFTSAEHLTLSEAGANGNVWAISAEWDASAAGLEGLTLAAGYFTLTDSQDTESTELDLTASYALNDNFSVDIIYSDVDDKINTDEFENTRVFVNYSF